MIRTVIREPGLVPRLGDKSRLRVKVVACFGTSEHLFLQMSESMSKWKWSI